MRNLSRLVLVCSSVFAFQAHAARSTELKPDVADEVLNGAPTPAEPAGSKVAPAAATGAAAAPAPRRAAAPRVIPTGQPAPAGLKKRYTREQRAAMRENKVLRQAWRSRNAKVKERMRVAWSRFGPDLINHNDEIKGIERELRAQAATDREAQQALLIDPPLEGPTAEGADEFFSEYGKLDGPDDVVGGDDRPEGRTCSTCAAVAGTIDRLNGTIGELKGVITEQNERIARLEAERRIPAAVPVAVGPERNLTGNSIGFGIALGPILAALLGNRNQQNRGGFFPPPGRRMPFAPVIAGPAGRFGPRFGNGGFGGNGLGGIGGGAGFGAGGRNAPIVAGPASGGYSGIAGQAGYPAAFPYQNYQTGSGIIYNQSASAVSPLGIGSLTGSPIMAGSLNAPIVAGRAT